MDHGESRCPSSNLLYRTNAAVFRVFYGARWCPVPRSDDTKIHVVFEAPLRTSLCVRRVSEGDPTGLLNKDRAILLATSGLSNTKMKGHLHLRGNVQVHQCKGTQEFDGRMYPKRGKQHHKGAPVPERKGALKKGTSPIP